VQDNFCDELESVFDKFPKYLMKVFSAKVVREDIFNPIIGNDSLHEISTDNGVRIVNFATLKISQSIIQCSLQHPYIYTWMSPDGKKHNRIDHILIDRPRHSSVLDVQSFRAVDCDTDHYLLVAKVVGRLAVNEQKSQRFHMERFNHKKFSEVEGKEKYHIEVSNRFAALEDLDAEVEINSAWEMVRENITISAKESLGYFELKKQEPWLDERCSELLDPRKQAKLQWLQDPSEINGDNLNNVRCEASRCFRNKKRKYLKDKIDELAMNSKNRNIRDLYRGINEFKKGYHHRSNLVKDAMR
jgi:hypothetical protein